MKIRKIFEQVDLSDIDDEIIDMIQDFIDVFEFNMYEDDIYVSLDDSNHIQNTSSTKTVGLHRYLVINMYEDIKNIETMHSMVNNLKKRLDNFNYAYLIEMIVTTNLSNNKEKEKNEIQLKIGIASKHKIEYNKSTIDFYNQLKKYIPTIKGVRVESGRRDYPERGEYSLGSYYLDRISDTKFISEVENECKKMYPDFEFVSTGPGPGLVKYRTRTADFRIEVYVDIPKGTSTYGIRGSTSVSFHIDSQLK